MRQTFLSHLKQRVPGAQDSKVIVYSGILAAKDLCPLFSDLINLAIRFLRRLSLDSISTRSARRHLWNHCQRTASMFHSIPRLQIRVSWLRPDKRYWPDTKLRNSIWSLLLICSCSSPKDLIQIINETLWVWYGPANFLCIDHHDIAGQRANIPAIETTFFDYLICGCFAITPSPCDH